MAESITSICNQGLGVIGAKRINDFENDTSIPAIQCRLHYQPTKDALLRSFGFRFAAAREELSQDTVSPSFEYDNQFILPSDFMAFRSVFEDNSTIGKVTLATFALEDERLLTNESSVKLRYTKQVNDASKFDPLFVEVLVFHLADKFIGPLAGGDKRIQEKIDRRLAVLIPKVRALDRQEQNNTGRNARNNWVESRLVTSSGFHFHG